MSIAPDHLIRICEEFQIGDNPVLVENHEGVLNKNYELTTDQGKFFIKSIREKRRPSIPYITEVERFFAGRGIPAVCMLRTRTGSSFLEYDSQLYTLYAFLESVRTHIYDLSDFRRMGEMLGRIHIAGSKDVPIALSQKVFDEKPREMVEANLLKHRTSIKEKQLLDNTDMLFLEYIDLKLSMLAKAAHVDLLPMDTLAHGDFHSRNLLMSSTREIIGVCDWEQASMNARSYELARSLLYVCFNGESEEESHLYDNRHALESARAFIGGYAYFYPISSEELLAGIRMRWKKLIYSFWIEEQYYTSSDTRSNKFIPHEMRLIRDFADQELLNDLAA